MKIRPIRSKKQLSAATAARSMPHAGQEDDEPTMKLSNAFIVVVILHLVAVGGIYTFESIKVHRPTAAVESGEPAAAQTASVQAPAMPVEQKATQETATLAAARTTETRPLAPVAPVAAATAQPSAPAPAAASGAIEDSGQVHVVAKGENPYNIARQYEVSYDELMQLNKIDDPRRLQPNQKLRIPVKR